MASTNEFPDAVRIRGMDFMHQGWNTIFEKTEELSNGYPVYYMKTYKLYGFFQIFPAKLIFNGTDWTFVNCGLGFQSVLGKKNGTNLIGDYNGMWINDFRVEKETSYFNPLFNLFKFSPKI